MATNGFQAYNSAGAGSSYGDRASSTGSGDAELAADPASSSFFATDYKKHEDLKGMLDSNKDALKLEAMKRIISMVARGKDCSDLFPAVVKNVVSKDAEVKKLVYVYLTRYAEEQQDLALLSISTFQRALKDPNQLIRASALRVLSSIRVQVIVPIMMLAIKDGCNDMSAYVRKAAAHAIPKLYSIDEEQKDQLIEVIEKLLGDKTTLVAGSAIQAFEEVCPERIDLIHRNYRKLCGLLVDVEEWGQVVIINMLTRYARTQFIDPNKDESSSLSDSAKNFYDEDNSEDNDEDCDKNKKSGSRKPHIMDPDHRLLLRTCKPLLNSRNASVVMSVVQLYYHCAPKGEVGIVGKSLIRLLRSNKEVQHIVLSNIASMTLTRKGMFEPFLKSFYVRANDPTQVKILKLEILTNLASETSISTILREFQTYVASTDKEFAAATIQAIGRCASNIAEVTDTCLNGLVALMSKRDEVVVAEAVVVIKKLLQMQSSDHKDIIIHMARLVDQITVPMARASILWLIGEYCDRIPKIAPDVLRKTAKNFVNEEDLVKLQILNLAGKLCITNPKQTKLLCQYVLNLAKYDQNYDIRDRSRFLRALVLPVVDKSCGEEPGYLSKHAKKIFLATKPAPTIESAFKERPDLQLGSLSHLLNQRASGYHELPAWPDIPPDRKVRDVDPPTPPSGRDLFSTRVKHRQSDSPKRGFYSSDESHSGSSTSSESGSSSESGTDSEESASESSSEEEQKPSVKNGKPDKSETLVKKAEKLSKQNSVGAPAGDSGETESEDSSVSSDSESESDSSDEQSAHPRRKPAAPVQDLLLLDFDSPSAPSSGPPVGVLDTAPLQPLSTTTTTSFVDTPHPQETVPEIPSTSSGHILELVSRFTAGGVSASYRFTRTVSARDAKLTAVEIRVTNHGDTPVRGVSITTCARRSLPAGMRLDSLSTHPPDIPVLGPGAAAAIQVALDFSDTCQPAPLSLVLGDRTVDVSVRAPVGELVTPVSMTSSEFTRQQARLTGLHENTAQLDLSDKRTDTHTLASAVLSAANLVLVPALAPLMRFAGRTASGQLPVLVTLTPRDPNKDKLFTLTVRCEKMTLCSLLLRELSDCLKQ